MLGENISPYIKDLQRGVFLSNNSPPQTIFFLSIFCEHTLELLKVFLYERIWFSNLPDSACVGNFELDGCSGASVTFGGIAAAATVSFFSQHAHQRHLEIFPK